MISEDPVDQEQPSISQAAYTYSVQPCTNEAVPEAPGRCRSGGRKTAA